MDTHRLTLSDPQAAWRILAHCKGPLMLRREGHRLSAYLDFVEWHHANLSAPEASLVALLKPRPLLPLSFSGWIGFWSYDFLATHMGLNLKAPRDIPTPDGLFGRPGTLIHLYPEHVDIETTCAARLKALQRMANSPLPSLQQPPAVKHFHCTLDFTGYRERFEAAKEAILSGNTYQIKLSQRYEAPCTADPLTVFRKLDDINPSPEAFLLRTDDYALVSCSPETVIHKHDDLLQTRPIGGTWKKQPHTSNTSAQAAFTRDEKELSEHNMLVDLERNDLARVCQPGSIRVQRFREIEPYAHLYHLVSTIEGRLRPETDTAAIVKALLPGGSIVGCPKWRTMELIDQLEPSARGAYTGAFGSIADNGDLHFNLIIRTLVATQGIYYAQAGGGVVVDSTPEYEFRENETKAQALLEALS